MKLEIFNLSYKKHQWQKEARIKIPALFETRDGGSFSFKRTRQ